MKEGPVIKEGTPVLERKEIPPYDLTTKFIPSEENGYKNLSFTIEKDGPISKEEVEDIQNALINILSTRGKCSRCGTFFSEDSINGGRCMSCKGMAK